MRDIIFLLRDIRDVEQEQKLPLIRELGARTVACQIAGERPGRDVLSNLRFWLRDESLQYVISFGAKEALKIPLRLDEGLLQVSAARVTICYAEDCPDLSLRGIPAHHHIEKMIQQQSGGKVAILPDLTNLNPKSPEFLQLWGPFYSPWFSSRTPFSPAQCLIPVLKAGAQRTEGLLVVLAVLPKDTTTYIREPAAKMTELVNERLSRNRKGVSCHIHPLRPYGELMDVGIPPQSLRSTMGVDL